MLLQESNIEPYEEEKYSRILAAVLEAKNWDRSNVLAVSDVDGSLLVVGERGHLLANEAGIFNKRVNIGDWVSYKRISKFVEDAHGYSKAPNFVIEGIDENDTVVFKLEWGCGSDVGPSDAKRERDRVLQAMLHGHWPGIGPA